MSKVWMKLAFLNLRHQSPLQKVGFFFFLALALTILFLHYPFDGYDYQYFAVLDYSGYYQCAGDRYLVEAACYRFGEYRVSDFSEWRTYSPILSWFGSVKHTLTSLALVLVLGMIWVWVFRTEEQYEHPQEK